MVGQETLSELIKNYRKGYSLNRRFYKDPEIYDAEMKNIFLKNWLFAGHVSQIPNIGDYFLFEFDKESIIIVRTKDGNIKAHLNVCRHRGSQLCLEKTGNSKAFTCPYHAWSYDLNGELIAARLMNEEFDKKHHGLHQAHIELIGGLIFVSLAKTPLSLSAIREDLKDVFEQFGFDNMKVAAHKTYQIAANWKLANENYQECYHCAPSHQEFAKIHAMALTPAKFKERKKHFVESPENTIRTKASSFYFDLAIDGNECYQYDRNPLLQGMKSGSIGGKPVAPLLGTIKKYEGGTSEFMVGPVNFFLIYDDHMLGYRFTPVSLDECKCDVFWFVRGDAIEGEDYELEKLTWLWNVTTQADEKIITNNQKGVDSRYYSPGKLSEMEFFEQSFLNWYLKVMRTDI